MALVGTFKKGHYEATQPTEVEVTIPLDFSDENHPYYQKRGETFIEVQNNIEWVVDEIIENAYIVVKAIAIHLEDGEYQPDQIGQTHGKGYRVNIMYYIYLSKNDRLLNFNNYHLAEDASEIIYLDSLEDLMPNPITWAYNYIKSLPAFSLALDD